MQIRGLPACHPKQRLGVKHCGALRIERSSGDSSGPHARRGPMVVQAGTGIGLGYMDFACGARPGMANGSPSSASVASHSRAHAALSCA